MKFSLIVATLGRVDEIGRLFESLLVQTHREFEVLLVDQNGDDRLLPLVQQYGDRIGIRHMRSAPGLSRARNAALAAITGELVAFPDDDCVYAPGVLKRVHDAFTSDANLAGLTGRPAGDARFWDSSPGAVTRYNVWKRGISFTIFLRRTLVARVGGFDETLGVGAGTPWGAGEESDYLMRAMECGFSLRYEPTLEINHDGPIVKTASHTKRAERAFRYAMGTGRVLSLRKMPVWYVAYKCSRPMAGMAAAIVRLRWEMAQVYWAVVGGTLKGYLAKIESAAT